MIAADSQENHAMKPNELLIEHIDRLHTTPMGAERIKRNLKLDTDDAVGYEYRLRQSEQFSKK